MNKQIWVFLSHSNKDYDRVKEVRNMLESMSFRPIMFYLLCLSDNDEVVEDDYEDEEDDFKDDLDLIDDDEFNEELESEFENELLKGDEA